MKRQTMINYLLFLFMVLLPCAVCAWSWDDLWHTADQQAARLLQKGQAKEAMTKFKNPNWQGVAAYRAKDYAQSYARFKTQKTSDGQYNAGNAAAFLGRYPEALAAYDQAIKLNPQNADAIFNREIIKKLLQNKPQQNAQQDKAQNKLADKEKTEQSKEQQQQQQSQNEQQSQNKQQKQQQSQNEQQKNSNNAANTTEKKPTADQQNETKNDNLNTGDADVRKQSSSKEEENQLFRRLDADPGGLLRQKFLRDYSKRHAALANEGEN